MEAENLKVLAIDGDRDDLAALKAALRAALPGCTLVTAVSGATGLELARDEDPDVILLDIVMPGMDGIEVCRVIKADKRLQATPVLFLTAPRSDRESRVRALDAGAEGFLSKPWEESELIAQIRAMAKIKLANRLLRSERKELAALVGERTRALEEELEARGRAEEALRESEARYRALFENSLDAILLTVPDGTILSANPAACRMFGRTEAEIRALGRAALVDAGDPRLPRLLEERARTGRATGELTFIRKDGSSFPGEVSSVLFEDTSGAMRSSMIIRDVTERTRSERSLVDSEARYRELFESNPQPMWVYDLETLAFLAVNDAAVAHYGYRREEFLNMTILDLHPPGKRLELVETVRQVPGPMRRVGVWPQLRKDGAIREVEIATHDVSFAGRDARLVLSHDVTDRKRAETELREAEARYRLLFDQSPDGIVIIDPTTARVLQFNETAHRQLGYSREEFARLSVPDVEAAETPEETQERIARVIREGRNDFETRHRTRQGEIRNIHVTAQLTKMMGRTVYHCVWRDITEQLRLAREKAQLEEHLLQAQKIEAIGRLAGGVAHDFNNLTAIVLGYGEMLLKQIPVEDPRHTWAEQIVAAGRRSAALTRQLLAFSRKQVLQPEVLDLNALVRNLETMLGRLIGEDVDLKLRLAADLGRVQADPGQLEQAVTNLVLNARDAMPRGGKLTIETADVELGESYVLGHECVVPGRYVLLALTDTGCGMDKATLARLFEPFFTTKPRGKGTGLGLATVYGIVKQSGGYIYVYSEPGKGTTFKIYLPRTEAEPAPKSAEPEAATPRGGGERILLVEDEASLLQLCATTLGGLGYRVSGAASGAEALLMVEMQRLETDLVVTDVVMPGMSGTELIERLRRHRPELKVLFMSGYPDEAIARHGVLDPGLPFIQKPFTEHSLAVAVREALTRKPASAMAGKRVLMIDDDEQYRELARHFCSARGHRFTGVDSAAEALEVLATQRCDVVLLDLNIPGTSGSRILRELRAAGHAAPAIVLTGDVASADMDALRRLGVLAAVEKSSRPDALLGAIEETGRVDAPGREVDAP